MSHKRVAGKVIFLVQHGTLGADEAGMVIVDRDMRVRVHLLDSGLRCKADGQRLADTICVLGITDTVRMDLEIPRPLLRGNLTQALPHVDGTQEGREREEVLLAPSLKVRLLVLLDMDGRMLGSHSDP